jgi:AcrR family transcriptional regulator
MVSNRKRASGDQEKGERRSQILERADELFKDRSVDELRMADLAAELGLAKGTLYLYFPSKEALFLALLGDRLESAFAKLFDSLGIAARSGAASAPAITPELVAEGTAAIMAEDLALPRLLAITHSVLESRLPFEEALAFKRGLAMRLDEAGSRLAAALPPLSAPEGRRYFLYLYAQVVGLASLTDLSPFMRKISAEPGLGAFRLGFREGLEESARAMLAGMMKAARHGGGEGERT